MLRVLEWPIESKDLHGQALLEILDDSSLEFEFIVPSKWQARLKIGLPFRVHIDATGTTYPAKVQRIGARIDAWS